MVMIKMHHWSHHHQAMWRWWRLIRCIIGSVTALIYSFSSSSLMASNSSGVRKSVLWATRFVFLPCFLRSCLGSNCSPINAFEASGKTESLTERVGQNSASDTHSSATLKKYRVRLIHRFSLDIDSRSEISGNKDLRASRPKRFAFVFALSDLLAPAAVCLFLFPKFRLRSKLVGSSPFGPNAGSGQFSELSRATLITTKPTHCGSTGTENLVRIGRRHEADMGALDPPDLSWIRWPVDGL